MTDTQPNKSIAMWEAKRERAKKIALLHAGLLHVGINTQPKEPDTKPKEPYSINKEICDRVGRVVRGCELPETSEKSITEKKEYRARLSHIQIIRLRRAAAYKIALEREVEKLKKAGY